MRLRDLLCIGMRYSTMRAGMPWLAGKHWDANDGSGSQGAGCEGGTSSTANCTGLTSCGQAPFRRRIWAATMSSNAPLRVR